MAESMRMRLSFGAVILYNLAFISFNHFAKDVLQKKDTQTNYFIDGGRFACVNQLRESLAREVSKPFDRLKDDTKDDFWDHL